MPWRLPGYTHGPTSLRVRVRRCDGWPPEGSVDISINGTELFPIATNTPRPPSRATRRPDDSNSRPSCRHRRQIEWREDYIHTGPIHAGSIAMSAGGRSLAPTKERKFGMRKNGSLSAQPTSTRTAVTETATTSARTTLDARTVKPPPRRIRCVPQRLAPPLEAQCPRAPLVEEGPGVSGLLAT